LIPQYDDPEKALAVLAHIDGLLISGGNDIFPDFYGEPIRNCSTFLPMRDVLEISLAKETVSLGKPLLGVCRGLQIMNTAFGGTLYQDLRENAAYGPHLICTMPKSLPAHKIVLPEDSPLREICGSDTLMVNSFHHQAVNTLPENAKVCAVAPDGLVESVSYAGGHPFTIGVQWHPEMMQQCNDEQKKIFKTFVVACSEE